MSIETGLYSELTTDVDVAALVSTRVYPLTLPQGYTLPAITYQRVSTERLRDLTGSSGWVMARFQIDCWAASYSAARGLADKVRAALDGQVDTLGSETGVGMIGLMGEREILEEEIESYRVSFDFMIPYTET